MTSSTSRRGFLRSAALAGAGVAASRVLAADTVVQMPFENGERSLVAYPQKRPLLRLTSRPPQWETPMSVFNEGILTPNDAFFVRYHLPLNSPPQDLDADTFKAEVCHQVRRVDAWSLQIYSFTA